MSEDKDSRNIFNGQSGTKTFKLLASGKRLRAIDLESYSENQPSKDEEFFNKNLDVQDLLRARYNKYWSPFGKNGNAGLPKIDSVSKGKTPIKDIIFDRILIKENTEDGDIFEILSQEFKILPNKNFFKEGVRTSKNKFNKNMWSKFIADEPLSLKSIKGPLPSYGDITATPIISNLKLNSLGKSEREEALKASIKIAQERRDKQYQKLQEAENNLNLIQQGAKTDNISTRRIRQANKNPLTDIFYKSLDGTQKKLETSSYSSGSDINKKISDKKLEFEKASSDFKMAQTHLLNVQKELDAFLLSSSQKEFSSGKKYFARLNWTFFNADEVEVFREDGEKLTRLGSSAKKESLDTNTGINFKRKQIRDARLPTAGNNFLKSFNNYQLPQTRFETRLEIRSKIRINEFARRQQERMLLSPFSLSGAKDTVKPEKKVDFNSGAISTEINGIKTFKFIARNANGVLMVRVRYNGRMNGLNFNVVPIGDGPQISIVPNADSANKDTPFSNMLPTINTDAVFFDHAFDVNIPFSKKIIDKQNAPVGSMFAEVKPVYNFFIDNYEQIIGSSNTSEKLLPNMYAFLTELQNENTDEKNTIFKQHITLAGTIPDIFVDVVNQKGEKIGEKDKGQYFDKYARAFNDLIRINPDKESELVRKFTNLVTPISNIDLFKEFNEKRELFPMFFDINFSTDRLTQFAEILKDSQISNILMRDVIQNNIPLENKKFVVAEASQIQEEKNEIELQKIADRLNKQIKRSRSERGRRQREVTRESIRSQFDNKIRTETTSEIRELEMWDMTEWIQRLSENPLSSFSELDAGVFLGKYNNEIKMAESSQFDFFKNLLVIIFAGKAKKLVERELRTFEEILNGKLAYSETAFYKIEKRDTTTGNIIQNFFLPNSNDINIMRFIDTQVKYNKQYTYEIFAYQFVIGNKYSYELKEITEDEAKVIVHNMPSVKLVKIPYYTFTGRIMDNPPIFPDVSILPFKSVNNRIKFHLNGNVGEYKLEPVLIEPGDEEIIKKLREAQMVSEKEFLLYAGDDRVSAFEIFRINKRPRKFADFTGNRIALVKTDIDSLTLQSATAAAFIDNILPNRKYYYIFRAIDNHGHISNPTPIYELEIVDNDGIIFPVVKNVDFDKDEDTKAATKGAKRFIQITPSFQQVFLNEEKSGLIDGGRRVSSILNRKNFHLGFAEEQVWEKRFKIRLTSQSTGRKIDFNIDFKHENIKKDESQ